jgi:ammonium transporter Rh
LIGTAFLWIYWPSFVAGAAQADSDQQQRAIVNTIMALSSSTVATFWLTSLLSKNGRMRPVDIQNATLAGGVAIGCTANLTTSVFGAIMIGIFAGLVSTAGYNILQPWLEINLGLHDTCGIHNLHAMPSVIGAFASVILAGYKGDDYRHHDSAIYGQNSDSQWWRQLVGIVLCITFAITAGLTVGWLLRKITSNEEGGVTPFHDSSYWEVIICYFCNLIYLTMLTIGC